MNCREFEEAIVDDDPAVSQAAERHADDCSVCAAVLSGQRRLQDRVEAWKDHEADPPPELLQRIELAVLANAAAPGRSAQRARPAVPVWAVAAVAAVLLVAVGLRLGLGGSTDPLDGIERARQDYARQIARLEAEVEPLLSRAGDPSVAAAEADPLVRYRDRLVHLDAVIAEVETFLAEHPGHSGGHTVLLAAYREKSELLRELSELDHGGKS